MTASLTQKGMFSNFGANTEGDFYRGLEYLMPRASRNPGNETARTAQHKRVSPIRAFARREHGHEIFIFLAVVFQHFYSRIQRARVFLHFCRPVKIISHSKSVIYNTLGVKKLNT